MRNHVYTICEQQRHRSALISAIVVRCLDSVIPLLAIAEISKLWLVSVAEQAGLNLTWSQTTEVWFSCGRAHIRSLNG